ncbi:MAG: DM13 domain-containing protein [Chloroflexota bacterium]|nr:DM13 domain-containing protein [Chloroflexota bacterium]
MATVTDRPSPPSKRDPRAPRPFWRKHFFKLTTLPLGVIAAIWFLVIQPHTNKTVDEAFPAAAPAIPAVTVARPVVTAVPAISAQSTSTTVPATAVQPVATAAPATAQAQTPPTAVPTSAPAATGPVAVKSGHFVKVEHDGSGTATIFKQGDGAYVLRFDTLDVTNGPDLRVRLLGQNGANLDLGGLKGNKGNQNYVLPADFDPATYDTADIWCRAFKVQFNTAALS